MSEKISRKKRQIPHRFQQGRNTSTCQSRCMGHIALHPAIVPQKIHNLIMQLCILPVTISPCQDWEVRLGSPKPNNPKQRLPERIQNSLSPVRPGTHCRPEVVPKRTSQSLSWNSQQYWGDVWDACLQERKREEREREEQERERGGRGGGGGAGGAGAGPGRETRQRKTRNMAWCSTDLHRRGPVLQTQNQGSKEENPSRPQEEKRGKKTEKEERRRKTEPETGPPKNAGTRKRRRDSLYPVQNPIQVTPAAPNKPHPRQITEFTAQNSPQKRAVTKIELRKNKPQKKRTFCRRFRDEKQGFLGPKNLPEKKPRTPVQSSSPKTLPKKPKTDRALKNPKNEGGHSPGKTPEKNGQHFPLIPKARQNTAWESQGLSGNFRSGSRILPGYSRNSSRNSSFRTRSIGAINSGKPFRSSTWNEKKTEC